MKNPRIPRNTKLELTMVLVLASLLTWITTAGAGEGVDEQLIRVVQTGDLDLVKKLLEEGASVNGKDVNGQTPLMSAAVGGHMETMKLLLEKGSNINARDISGDTALIRAVWYGRLEVVELLLQRGADVNIKSFGGKTALTEAAARDHHLVDNWWYFGLWSWIRPTLRGSTFARKYIMSTPSLHVEPYFGQDAEIVTVLLQKGADVNARDMKGWTALKRAQYRGAKEIVRVLRAHGAKE